MVCARFFSVVPITRRGGIGQILMHGKFHLNKNFTMVVTEHWNRMSRKVVESPSLEIFKSILDTILCLVL